MKNSELSKGLIVSVVDRHLFEVKSADGVIVLTSISTKMRAYLNKPDLEVGDAVVIQFSPYDRSRGRVHRSTFLL